MGASSEPIDPRTISLNLLRPRIRSPASSLMGKRDEPVRPASQRFRVTVRITTMALDPNVIQPTTVAELCPSPGVSLQIEPLALFGPHDMGVEPLEMRYVVARQMQLDNRQLRRIQRTCRSVRNVPELFAAQQHHGRHGHDPERRHETMLFRTPALSHPCASTCHRSPLADPGNRLYYAGIWTLIPSRLLRSCRQVSRRDVKINRVRRAARSVRWGRGGGRPGRSVLQCSPDRSSRPDDTTR